MSAPVVRCACGTRNRVPSVAGGVPRCATCKSPLPWVVEAGDDDFSMLTNSDRVPVLVDLWAPWCGPCRQVSPVLEALAKERAGNLKLVKVNVDAAPQTQARFQVQAIPTMILFGNGRELARQQGAAPLPVLRQWLDSALTGTASAGRG